jgi:hypothetical protein
MKSPAPGAGESTKKTCRQVTLFRRVRVYVNKATTQTDIEKLLGVSSAVNDVPPIEGFGRQVGLLPIDRIDEIAEMRKSSFERFARATCP